MYGRRFNPLLLTAMKRNLKITFCGIIAALAAVVMLLSYFPYLTYAVPAVAGLLLTTVVIEIGLKWSVCTFFASVFPIFLFAETECKLLYICFFGYYPILKAVFDSRFGKTSGWILKLLVFNSAVCAVYFVFAGLFGVPLDELTELGRYGVAALWLFGNFVFVVYDIAVSRSVAFYMNTLHPRVQKAFKGF